MSRLVWLETGGTVATFPALLVCASIAQAVARGNDGDSIYQFCSECERCAAGDRCGRMARYPTHRIRVTRTNKKRAIRLT